MRTQEITVRTEVFVGQGIRWTRGGGGLQGPMGGESGPYLSYIEFVCNRLSAPPHPISELCAGV